MTDEELAQALEAEARIRTNELADLLLTQAARRLRELSAWQAERLRLEDLPHHGHGSFEDGAKWMREQAFNAAHNCWQNAPADKRANELSHGVLASMEAIRTLPTTPPKGNG